MVPGTQKGGIEKETRTYATITDDLGALAQWLQAKEVTHVVMESTGVYWKPVFNLLEGQFAVIVVNAERSKALRGAKSCTTRPRSSVLSRIRTGNPVKEHPKF
jgi:transposase